MSTTKGRKIVKDQAGNGIYQDTVPKKSAQQAILVNQDAEIDALNALKTALSACASRLTAAAAIADVNAAGTALTTALGAITIPGKANLE